MSEWFAKFFNTNDFPARWHCGLWSPFHGWLHIACDLAIWSAYTTIPIIILYYMVKRKEIEFPRVGWLFAAFIFFCGTGHLLEASIFWWPNYRLAGAVKLCTAVASWGTVIALIPIMPKALEMPGLRDVVNRLQQSMRSQETIQTALEDRNRELETMLQIISHDLREPIRGIRGLISMLEQQIGNKTVDDSGLIARIDASGRRLDDLVRGVLAYSQARNAPIHHSDPIDLAEIVEDAKARLADTIATRKAQITVAAQLPAVYANREWVTAAVYNLLNNALRYAGDEKKPPEILVEAVESNLAGEIGLVIHDRGPGVPESMQERIFELFRQGLNRDREGTGTGLAIVKEVAARHGGRAWVENREGGGASFYLTFEKDPPNDQLGNSN